MFKKNRRCKVCKKDFKSILNEFCSDKCFEVDLEARYAYHGPIDFEILESDDGEDFAIRLQGEMILRATTNNKLSYRKHWLSYTKGLYGLDTKENYDYGTELVKMLMTTYRRKRIDKILPINNEATD